MAQGHDIRAHTLEFIFILGKNNDKLEKSFLLTRLVISFFIKLFYYFKHYSEYSYFK